MLAADTVHPDDLRPEDAATWRALCARNGLDSPLLGPEFAQAVGGVRRDARVTVWRRDGRPVAFLAYHRRPGGLARPLGAPLADYHGLVSDDPTNVSDVLLGAGLSAYRFTGLLAGGDFDGVAGPPREAYVIELKGAAEDYWEALRAASPKRFKNYRRLHNKMQRELGEVVVVAPDYDPAAFETLIAWKRGQLARTGRQDFLAPPWTMGLLRNLFETREGDFRGLMVNLYAGGRLIAGHFGVRQGTTYHPWIAAADPEAAALSPGQVFLWRAIGAMQGLGLVRYDLGPGHDHYKRPYASMTRLVIEGMAWPRGSSGVGARLAEQAWSLAGARRGGAVASLRRRLDTIAVVELSLSGRVRGFASALAARALRPARGQAVETA